MAGLLGLINRLLPFATPGTPLVQDLLHLAALCTALYFAPQIQSYFQTHSNEPPSHHENAIPDPPHAPPGLPTQAPPAPFVEDDSDSASDNDNDDLPNLPEEVPQFGIPRAPLHDIDAAVDPVNPHPNNAAPATPSSTRTVGAKKAKSLARKDQRRAYHEFMRSQGEAQRARDAEGAREREAVAAAERARRAEVDAGVEARRAEERERRREREAVALREEMERRERAVGIVRREVEETGVCDLGAVARGLGGSADGSWVEQLVRAAGMLGRRGDGDVVIVTESGWVVRVGREDMERAYRSVLDGPSGDETGRIPYEELGKVLESEVRSRVAT